MCTRSARAIGAHDGGLQPLPISYHFVAQYRPQLRRNGMRFFNRAAFCGRGVNCMRMLLVGALIASLMGCCRAPPQATLERCTTKGCVQRTAANPQTEIKRVAFKTSPEPAILRSTTAPAPAKPESGEPSDQTGLIGKNATSVISPTPDTPAPRQSNEALEAVMNKAKATTAAILNDPESAEFDDMKRAIRKGMSGQPVDSICGRVKEKRAGESVSDRPFVYLVKEDKAYIDDGNSVSVAATWYRGVCINPDSPKQDSSQHPTK